MIDSIVSAYLYFVTRFDSYEWFLIGLVVITITILLTDERS